MTETNLPIVVVGAGASGMLAALHAASIGRRVVVLERTNDGGRKIALSGGGRCNILPTSIDARDYHTDSSPNTLKKILKSWPLAAQRSFFEKDAGLALAEEEGTGKLFPATGKARDVRDRLFSLAEKAGCTLRTGAIVTGLEPPADPATPWQVNIKGTGPLKAVSVILATGGYSFAQTGSDGTGLAIASTLGHTVHTTYPALTPLTLAPPRFAALAGVSIEVTLSLPVGGKRVISSGGFLFTHQGYSGPAVLEVSHYVARAVAEGRPQPVFVAWTSETADDIDLLLQSGQGPLPLLLSNLIPQRLTQALLVEAGLPQGKTVEHLRREDRRRLTDVLTHFSLPCTGTEGYGAAEVTGGGVALDEVDHQTLESRLHPGLFLCGEMLDAFGRIGGYNLAWAWLTGRLAGLGSAHRAGLPAAHPQKNSE